MPRKSKSQNTINSRSKSAKQKRKMAVKRRKALVLKLKTHVQARYCCGDCFKIFKSSKRLQYHLQVSGHTADLAPKIMDVDSKEPQVRTSADSKEIDSCNNKTQKKALRYCCGVCLKTFKSPKRLENHLQVSGHTADLTPKIVDVEIESSKKPQAGTSVDYKEVKISCTQCIKKFKFKKSYENHLKQEHSTLPNAVSCEICDVRCPSQPVLDDHIKNVHNRSMFQCPHCKKSFVRHYHVLRHLEQKGCDGNGKKSIECEICYAKFSRKDNLLTHLRTHVRSKMYICPHDNCGFESGKFTKHVNHYQQQHMGNTFECDDCGKTTSSRAAMMKHMEIHGGKKFACEVCGYESFTIEVMRRHLLRHTADKPYKCSICTQSFIQVSQLRNHLLRHLGFKCQRCGIRFQKRVQYLHHVKQKKNCNADKKLDIKDQIDSASLVAIEALEMKLSVEDHKCDVCNKTFFSEVNLKRHMSTHRLEKPRRCMYCVTARAYIRGHMLVRHVRVRHPAIFKEHLLHVREVMGYPNRTERVSQSEMESVLNLLDAISDRIIEQNSGDRVLYGGIVEMNNDDSQVARNNTVVKKEASCGPVLPEPELVLKLGAMLQHLLDADTMQCFGWPDHTVDVVLEKLIEKCGQTPADKTRWSRVQCLRENTKHLFIHVVEDKAISRMLETHTIDQVIVHIVNLSENTDEQNEKNTEQNDDYTNRKIVQVDEINAKHIFEINVEPNENIEEMTVNIEDDGFTVVGI